jgi:hypothetical protein
VCERPLPEEFLMSDAEKTYWKNQMAKEEKQAKNFGRQMNDIDPHQDSGGFGMI